MLKELPTTTFDCEQSFSDMNLMITDLKTRLTIGNVSILMFILMNGSPINQSLIIWGDFLYRSAVSITCRKERKKKFTKTKISYENVDFYNCLQIYKNL